MKKLMGWCWWVALSAIGCGTAPISDGGRQAGDDLQDDRANPGESSSALSVVAYCASNADCSSSSTYCKFPPGKCAGRGVCAPRPSACTQVFAPVCGCDVRTYSNACIAATSGVSVASEGACEQRRFCGGFTNRPCPKPSVCIDDPTDECDPNHGGSDCIGICVP